MTNAIDIRMTKEITGICSICAYSATCSFLKESKQPINFCEEFEIIQVDSAVKTSTNNSSPISKEDEQYTGICRNCDLRKSCSFRTTDKIVMHCEEYR